MPLPRSFGISLAFAAALGSAGCGSVAGVNGSGLIGDLPPEAPAREAVQAPYPDIYATPPPRDAKLVSESEQARIEAELAASRQKVQAQAEALRRERIGSR